MALTAQTDSRIADASRNWQAACNLDVSDWDKANEFILSTWALSDSVNPDSDCKLQWRRAAGVFADVGADTEICWGTATVLVDGAALLEGNSAACLGIGILALRLRETISAIFQMLRMETTASVNLD